jgi:hypothetical protein
MGYKDHYSNPDIRPRRVLVLLDVEIHAKGYKDHFYWNFSIKLFSNEVICTIEIFKSLWLLENIQDRCGSSNLCGSVMSGS